MAELNKRQYKDLDKKITEMKEWIETQKEELSNRKLLNNFSFLTTILDRAYAAMEQARTDMMGMQTTLSKNMDLTMEFIGSKELSTDWEEFIRSKQEAEDNKNDPNFKEAQKLKEQLKEAEEEEENGDED